MRTTHYFGDDCPGGHIGEMNKLNRDLAKQAVDTIFREAGMTPLARASDPAPSHDAERHLRQSGKLSKQQAEVLWWIKNFPGHTSRELQEMSAWTQELFHRRAVELCRAGLIVRGEPRRCKIGGRLAATWSLKEPKP